MDCIYDRHTLCIRGDIKSEVLRNLVTAAIKSASKFLKKKFKYRLAINVPTSKTGASMNFAYIWVDSEEIYWLLLGKNLDGSERKTIENERRALPAEELFDMETGNWGDMPVDDLEEESLPQNLGELLIGEEIVNVSRAYIFRDETFHQNKLKIRVGPEKWPSKEQLEKRFLGYSTGNISSKEIRCGKNLRYIILTFSNGEEALFARLMLKKFLFKYQKNEKEFITSLVKRER